MEFETLYGTDKNGKIKSWNIKVVEHDNYSEIIIQHGYINLIETRTRIDKGKNLGKSNATTHLTQAIADATSKWNKKIEIEKYSKSDSKILNNYKLPMLAQDYHKHSKKVSFPVAIQPKLDGYRCIYDSNTKICTTRQGKNLYIIKQHVPLYNELLSLKDLVFDGELFTSKINFETLGVLRKTKTLTKDDLENLNKIEYHIYDIIDAKKTFKERNLILQKLFEKSKFKTIVYVNTIIINSVTEISKYHLEFIKNNYEGTIIRNLNGLYKEKYRSTDLLKYKDFMDSEFQIVDYSFENDTSGDAQNLIVWIVQVDDVTCKVRPQGTTIERKELFKKCTENFNQFKGKNLWVKYFEKTSDGNLRFPTTLRNTWTEYIRNQII